MYKVIIILIFSFFCFACKQNKSSGKMHLSKENILPKDTSSHFWYPIDLSGTKNVKLCLAYHTTYKYWKIKDKRYTSVQSRKMNILYYDPSNLPANFKDSKSTHEDRSNFKIIYTTNYSDSLLFSDAVQESIRYYGNYFIVFFPKWTETCRMSYCDIPEDKNGYFLNEPIVFYIDTVNIKAIKLKYNPRMKAYSSVNYKNARPFIHTNGSGFTRNFAFSIKHKEFVFGKRSRN